MVGPGKIVHLDAKVAVILLETSNQGLPQEVHNRQKFVYNKTKASSASSVPHQHPQFLCKTRTSCTTVTGLNINPQT